MLLGYNGRIKKTLYLMTKPVQDKTGTGEADNKI